MNTAHELLQTVSSQMEIMALVSKLHLVHGLCENIYFFLTEYFVTQSGKNQQQVNTCDSQHGKYINGRSIGLLFNRLRYLVAVICFGIYFPQRSFTVLQHPKNNYIQKKPHFIQAFPQLNFESDRKLCERCHFRGGHLQFSIPVKPVGRRFNAPLSLFGFL